MSIQKINVKNTYVATVKSDIADRALSFYVDNDKKNIFVEDSIFTNTTEANSVNNDLSLENNALNFNEVANATENNTITVPEKLNITDAANVPSNNEVSGAQNVPVNTSSVEEDIKQESVPGIPNLNVLEPIANSSEPVNPMPMPNIPEANIHPEPIPNPVNEPVNPTPINENFTNIGTMVNSVPVTNEVPINNNPVRFDASHETNLLGALEENNGQNGIGNINVTPDNLNAVREFGVDEPIMTDSTGNPIVNPSSGGFINSKILLVVVIILFLASCVFLGYEIYNYFILSK